VISNQRSIEPQAIAAVADQHSAASGSTERSTESSHRRLAEVIQHRATSDKFALLIFAKYPEPGKVKTRLAASLGLAEAASLYEQFVRHTLEIGKHSGARQIFVAMAPAQMMARFREKFPGDFVLFAQADSPNLGDRIIAAARHVLSRGFEKILLIGTDSPNLPMAYLHEAGAALDTHDLVLGPAEDGGYYLIGFKKILSDLFVNVSWSSSSVLAQTLQHARRLNLRVHLLPAWYDVDDLSSHQRLVRDNPEFLRHR
jgi:hypothetical protein